MIGSSVKGWMCCGIARSLEIAKVAIIESGGVQEGEKSLIHCFIIVTIIGGWLSKSVL